MNGMTLAVSDLVRGVILEVLEIEPSVRPRLEQFALALPELLARSSASWAQLVFGRLGCEEGRQGTFETVVLVSGELTYVGQRLPDDSMRALVALAPRGVSLGSTLAEVTRTARARAEANP